MREFSEWQSFLVTFSKKVTQQAPSIEGSSSKIPLQIIITAQFGKCQQGAGVKLGKKAYPRGTLSRQDQAAFCCHAYHGTGGFCGLF